MYTLHSVHTGFFGGGGENDSWEATAPWGGMGVLSPETHSEVASDGFWDPKNASY